MNIVLGIIAFIAIIWFCATLQRNRELADYERKYEALKESTDESRRKDLDKILAYHELVESMNVYPEEWKRINSEIEQVYNQNFELNDFEIADLVIKKNE